MPLNTHPLWQPDSSGNIIPLGGKYPKAAANEWDDSMVPATALGPGGAAPALTALWGTAVQAYAWDQTDSAYFQIQLPHSWDTSTSVYIHVHMVVSATAAVTSNVKFSLDYVAAGINQLFQATPTTIAETFPINGLVPRQHTLLRFSTPIEIIVPSISSIICCKLSRSAAASDDYGSTRIPIIGVDAHFQKDTAGSKSETSKT